MPAPPFFRAFYLPVPGTEPFEMLLSGNHNTVSTQENIASRNKVRQSQDLSEGPPFVFFQGELLGPMHSLILPSARQGSSGQNADAQQEMVSVAKFPDDLC